MAALKYLSDNSNISVILVLASMDWLSFFIQVEICLILGMKSGVLHSGFI